ncbi:hypothetical protein TTHERM_00852800 (macronuclear) [Tetrahymena thermophila SB210]|uniref:Uncharacterized protein n=1 Tax=Tetrahymena thermophila (strain SB210) TaxID=312017 RepID=Q24E60_TETTS|nr:hypothetical protein TTHERM_00852800 [Tetrahymena thermophila SB210]EAS06041.2 hypothetical protein TTHERM_00852800 [Tetrahymena thermophila SB210]|eukprot:XP_001026286.2 hypothetical protein TTHERM_00852800 [Tetrahymena thermophila SB210]
MSLDIKRLKKDDSCFRLGTLEEIQNTFNQIVSDTKQISHSQIGEQYHQKYILKDPYIKDNDFNQSMFQQLDSVVSFESEEPQQIQNQLQVEQPKDKPRKILKLINKNGYLIKVSEEIVQNDKQNIKENNQQCLKIKMPVQRNTIFSSKVNNNSIINRKNRCHSQNIFYQNQNGNQQEDCQNNCIVQEYGENLIQTVFKSLVLNKIKSLEQSQCDSSIFNSVSTTTADITSEIVKEFGISTSVLQGFNTFEGKKNYIIQQMNETLDRLLNNFKEKINKRETKTQVLEKDISKSNGFNNLNDPHYLDWLQISSKYKSINLKLKEMVLLYVNKYENSVKVIENMKKNGIKVKHLADYVDLNTGDLLMQEQQQQIDPSNLLNKLINKTNEHDKWIQEIEQTIKDMEWNEDLEEQYQENIRQQKKQQTNLKKLTNGQNVGFSTNIYAKMKEEQQLQNRDVLLKKYQEGDHLDVSQLYFLANTSRLLNKCVDKIYEQEKVNTLSENILSNMELKIAEDIIYQYQKIKKGLSIVRNEYLQHKAKQDHVKFQIQKDQEQRKLISELNEQYHKKMVKIFKSYLSLKKKNDQSKLENLSYSSKALVKAFSNKLKLKRAVSVDQSSKKISMINQTNLPQSKSRSLSKQSALKNSEISSVNNYLIKNLQQTEEKELNKSVPRVANIKSRSLGNRIKSSEHHAPSKLFAYEDHLKPKQQQGTESTQRGLRKYYNSKKYDEQQLEKYDLKLHDHPYLKNQKQFIKFYSKGPGQIINEKDKIRYVEIKNPSKKLINNIIIIQRLIRGFLGRLKVKKLKQKMLDDLQNKINQISKQFAYNQKNLNRSKGSLNYQIPLNRDESIQTCQKQNKTYFLENSLKRSSTIKDDSVVKIQTNQSFANKGANRISNKSTNIFITPLKEKKYSLQQSEKLQHTKENVDVRKSISQQTLQQVKTDLLRQRLQSIIIAGESERRAELKKLNRDFQQLDKKCQNSIIYKSLQSKSQSPSSSQERKISKTEKKRAQQRKQTLFRGVMNNDLNYLCLVGHRWEKSDFNSKDKHLNTPLFYACKQKNVPLIKWLFSQGSNVNIPCSEGNTPLHLIFESNDYELIQYIIKENDQIDLNVRNQLGQTPVALCNQEIIQKLGLEKAITVVQSQIKRTNFDNNKLLIQNNNCSFEDKLIQDQSSIVFSNFNLKEQKSNFNHISHQRLVKKKSNLSIQSSISQTFSQSKNNF